MTGQSQKPIRRGTARARWGFDGIAAIVAPQWAQAKLQAAARQLPKRRRPIKAIVADLLALGGRYHRYLHQDEFGPARAERMAALREILASFDKLFARLDGLPPSLRSALAENHPRLVAALPEHDPLEFYSPGQPAIELLVEAATDAGHALATAGKAAEAALLASIRDSAETILLLLGSLDSTTEAEVIFGAGPAAPLSVQAEAADPSASIGTKLDRLRRRFEAALSSLEQRKGPEPRESLSLLVWELCDLWRQETGQPVTANPVRQGTYKSSPQSAAGRFVLAAVEALQPPPWWISEHKLAGIQVRAQFITGAPGARARAVHSAMRAYIAAQSAGSLPRRGRPRRK